ncbi:MAG: hypothetical protein HOM58_14740 [Rhodospirillaceae bacterium]|jgi:lysophospholipase L1-like esterase|nr:hypothetical protein [Rhodospirillaceae bacterium]MBT5456508.1 hypothetical protein [Rhodospirillaceae bacterium]MBT7248118.1 hypothetical protein [Rhodospirillaceae bacterium]
MKHAGQALLAVLIGLLILEGGLRLFINIPSPYNMPLDSLVWDDRGFWVFEPNTSFEMGNQVDFLDRPVTIGANGMRQVPCRMSSNSDNGTPSKRIFTIGDSQTFGFGLSDDDSWPNQLQCLLNDAEVYNLGVPGINTDQYLVRLSQIWANLTPRDVVLVMVGWNDLVTDQSKFNPQNIKMRPCPKEPDQSTQFPTCLAKPKFLLHPDKTWRLTVYDKTGLFIPKFGSPSEFANTAVMSSAFAYLTLPRLKLLWYGMRPKSSLFEKLPTKSFYNNLRIVGRMRELVEQKGATLVTTILPWRAFTNDSYYEAYSKGGVVFPARDFPTYASRAACMEFKLDCFSLFDALKSSKLNQYWLPYDGHLNDLGAKAVAMALAERIKAVQR